MRRTAECFQEKLTGEAMKKKIKTIYKARYVIDIEFTDEPMPPSDQDEYWKRIFNVKLESAFRCIDEEDGTRRMHRLNKKFDYVEKHFQKGLLDLYLEMLHLEAELGFGRLQSQKLFRQVYAKGIGNRAKQRALKRMELPKGRTPENEKYSFNEDKEKFISLCIDEIKNQRKVLPNKKITKTKIAESLYGYYANPLRELRKRLELYEITFEDIKAKTDQQP